MFYVNEKENSNLLRLSLFFLGLCCFPDLLLYCVHLPSELALSPYFRPVKIKEAENSPVGRCQWLRVEIESRRYRYLHWHWCTRKSQEGDQGYGPVHAEVLEHRSYKERETIMLNNQLYVFVRLLFKPRLTRHQRGNGGQSWQPTPKQRR